MGAALVGLYLSQDDASEEMLTSTSMLCDTLMVKGVISPWSLMMGSPMGVISSLSLI